MSLILHAADISHPAKSWELHYRWTMALMEEFFRQVPFKKSFNILLQEANVTQFSIFLSLPARILLAVIDEHSQQYIFLTLNTYH